MNSLGVVHVDSGGKMLLLLDGVVVTGGTNTGREIEIEAEAETERDIEREAEAEDEIDGTTLLALEDVNDEDEAMLELSDLESVTERLSLNDTLGVGHPMTIATATASC